MTEPRIVRVEVPIEPTIIRVLVTSGEGSDFRGPFPDDNIYISEDGLLLVIPGAEGPDEGRNNIAIGNGALRDCTTGNTTVAIGTLAGAEFGDEYNFDFLESGKAGRASVFIGHVAGQYVGPVSSNTFIGGFCGRGFETDPITGGDISGTHPLMGPDNSGYGEATLLRIRGDARNNNAFGFNAGFGTSYAKNNCWFGVGSGFGVTGIADDDLASSGNSAFGHISYRYGDGRNNTFVGNSAGAGHSFATVNTQASEIGDLTFFLDDVTNASPGTTVFQGGSLPIGTKVLSRDLVAKSITVDQAAFNGIPVDFSYILVPNQHTGENNTGLGANALGDISGAADYNIAIGRSAGIGVITGDDNIFIGRSTGATLTSGSGNILIGRQTDVATAATTDTLNIGNALHASGINGNATAALFGIRTRDPTAPLDINGNGLRVRTARTPASAAATGNAGDICWDSNYIYVCTATNTWKRAALATW